ncbi:ATP-binding protein [uncultured Sphingomonas sp.]
MSDDVLFGEKFLTRYAGQIIADPATAIVELVANAWDAHATRVDITWPDGKRAFTIRDNATRWAECGSILPAAAKPRRRSTRPVDPGGRRPRLR